MDEWAPEAALAIDLCMRWAEDVVSDAPVSLYLLGSAIYADGDQFDALTSDIDIVAVMPEGLNAAGRVELMDKLRRHKLKLELDMIPALCREVCDEPGVSLVPVTPLEVKANVHKSGARRFFDRNFYLHLSTGIKDISLPDAGTIVVPDENRSALEYVQKIRNLYLGQAANGGGGLAPYRGADPIPKALLRLAAQLDRNAADGEWYDTRLGLEMIFDVLRERKFAEPWKSLFRCISIARGGRGRGRPLSDREQLLLAELLHDLATATQIDTIVLWEVRVGIPAPTAADVARLIAAIRAVAPDATLVTTRSGSVIVRFRSSAHRLDTMFLLLRTGVLGVLLESDDVDVRRIDGEDTRLAAFGTYDPESDLRDAISSWRPDFQREAEGAAQLANWLSSTLGERAFIQKSVALDGFSVASRVVHLDLTVTWLSAGGIADTVGIELVRPRSVAQFLRTIERLLDVPLRVIVVVVAGERMLDRVHDTVERLKLLGGTLSVVTIPDQREKAPDDGD